MTKLKLANELCKREGKKSEVARSNMMEVLTAQEEFFADEAIAKYGNGATVFMGDAFEAMKERILKRIGKKLKK